MTKKAATKHATPKADNAPALAPVTRLAGITHMDDERRLMFGRLESYFAGYMAFPNATWATIIALWAIGTWTFRSFDAFPYLVITSATKQSGKTRLMELLSFVVQRPTMTTDATAAVVARRMAEAADAGNGVTLMIDEAEKLAKENHPLRPLLNIGYRRGQVWSRVFQNAVVDYPVYGPKVFVLIGDVFDTLRDRSIVVTLERGTPAKAFSWSVAQADGMAMRPFLAEHARYTQDVLIPADFVGGREAEIWTPIFSLASIWCPDKMDAIVSAAADLAALKTAPKRRIIDNPEAEANAREATFSERALRDLAGIMGDRAKVLTGDAVGLLRAIPAGPWRVYRGDGLNSMLLSNMLSRFGIRPKQFKVKVDGKPTSLRGYARDDVQAAIATLGHPSIAMSTLVTE